MRMPIVVLMLAASLAAGCTGLSRQLSDSFDHDSAQAQRALDGTRAGNPRAQDSSDGVLDTQGLWFSGNTIKLTSRQTLPPMFSQRTTFDGTVTSLQNFAQRVTRLSGIPTRVETSARDAAPTHGGRSAARVPVLGAAPLPPLPTLPPLPSQPGLSQEARSTGPIHIAYRNGDLQGLLDSAAARFGVSWKYSHGRIDFFLTDTRTFQVSAIPGDATLNATVQSGATSDNGNQSGSGGITASPAMGGGASGSPNVSANNTTNTVVNAQLSVFNGLRTAIEAMLSPYGNAVASPATGSITVTDTPDVLDRVSAFMEQQNRSLSRQVLINVTVLSVTLSADDSYGIDWNAVYQALGTTFSLGNTFSFTSANPAQLAAQVITPKSRASGTNAMVSALSSQGKVRRKTSASITTLNNQPVPVQVAEQQGYLASVSTTNTANVGSETALVPGTITTGFNMTLLPHVLDDGSVLLQFYTNISSLVSLNTVTSGNQQIQTPDVDTRNFLQRVSMKSGETLVLSGYEGIDDDLNKQGIGSPSNYVTGGGFTANRSREVIVVLITPVLMSGA